MIPITAETMVAALKAAKPGDVFGLPPSLSQMPTLQGINPTGLVTITSQYPTNPAIIAGDFKVATCSNLTFTGLIIDLSTSADPFWLARITDVKNFTFSDVEIRGGGPGGPQAGAVLLEGGDRFSVIDSRIHDLPGAAINIDGATNTAIIGNDFYNWGKSAVGAASVQGFSFLGNKVHDAFPNLGTHADGLQLFTFGTTVQSQGITVAKNLMWVGEGWPFQGIFLQDELGTLPLLDVVVQDNYLYGLMWNNLWLNGVAGQSSLTNNVAVSWPQRDVQATTNPNKPVITPFTANMYTVVKGGTLTVTGNACQSLSDQNGKFVETLVGNTLLPHWA